MESSQISLVDIHIPFWRLVVLLIKFSIAAIPAAILLTALIVLLQGLPFVYSFIYYRLFY